MARTSIRGAGELPPSKSVIPTNSKRTAAKPKASALRQEYLVNIFFNSHFLSFVFLSVFEVFLVRFGVPNGDAIRIVNHQIAVVLEYQSAVIVFVRL